MMKHPDDLQLDLSGEEARCLHRVVRAMHDGHCPKCGYLGPANTFWRESLANQEWLNGGTPKVCPIPCEDGDEWHECPVCHFAITEPQARAALRAFRPFLGNSVEVFERWRMIEATTESGIIDARPE